MEVLERNPKQVTVGDGSTTTTWINQGEQRKTIVGMEKRTREDDRMVYLKI